MSRVLNVADAPPWRSPKGLPDRLAQARRTLTMGILNVTPDSFSDGGEHHTHDAAVAHARSMAADGADIVDVGGESTRPGGERVSEAEELRRVIPVVRSLAADGIVISVDTMRAEVASQAVQAGALIINDVSGGLADQDMLRAAADARTALAAPPVFAAMHWRGHSDVMNDLTEYTDVAQDVVAELNAQVEAALTAGVDREHLVLDPGFGFSKKGAQNWELLERIGELEAVGLPLLIGLSRKRFVTALDVDRDVATATLSAISAARHHWAVRVHDVAATVAAMRVIQRLYAGVDGTAIGLGDHSADSAYPRS